MTQTTPTPTDAAPQEPADTGASPDTLDAAWETLSADVEDAGAAPPEDASPSTPEPAGATPPEGAGETAPPAADDPIAAARRAGREEAEREYRAKLDGTHGNVKQWQTKAQELAGELEAIRKQLSDTDAARDAEFKELIDGADTLEARQYWQERQALDRDKREVAREKALSAARQEVVAAVQQQNIATATTGMRQQAIPAVTDSITGYAQELGLPPEEVADLIAAETGQSAQWLYANMPPMDLPAHIARRVLDLQPVIDRRAAAFKGRQADTEETRARENRQRDAATGRFATTQVGDSGGARRADPTTLDEAHTELLRRLQSTPELVRS